MYCIGNYELIYKFKQNILFSLIIYDQYDQIKSNDNTK